MTIRPWLLASALALAAGAAPTRAAHAVVLEDEASGVFVLPDTLVSAVEFWKGVYSTYDTRQVVLHDNRYLHVVYGVLDFRSMAKGRTASEIERLIQDGTDKERERIIANLLELAAYGDAVPFSRLTPEQRRIYDLFEDVEELDKFTAAAARVRGQRGQADRFLNGIAEVAPYMAEMEAIFREKGLPTDLTRLVFVESMFNLHAYSKVGAAGPWQFMSYTGKRFLTISPEVDERLDPIRSTHAAAALLAENHRHLGDWGLALTAYNHGVAGMRRAVEAVGTTDIGQIAWAYESRSFGFASRNFYAEFLAARDVYNHRERYFGAAALASLPTKTRPTYDEIVLPDYVAIGTFAEHCGVQPEELKALNPSLTRYVLSGQKYLPKGYPLKVPAGKGALVAKGYAKIPATHRYIAQKPSEWHVVRRGENLVAIARKYGMSVDSLVDLNGLSSRNRIRAGQKLRVLAPEKATSVAAASIAKTARKAPKEKEPEVKVVPVVKLPEDLAAEADAAAAPLPEEQEELLAAASAPAIEEGAPVAMAAVGALPSAYAPSSAAVIGRGAISLASLAAALPPPLPYVPPTAGVIGRGALSLAAIAAALPPPESPEPSTVPASAALAASPEPLAAPAALAEVAPLGVAPGGALAAIPPAEPVLLPLRPATSPIAPARSREDARAGEPAATYPGGIRCRLTAR